MSKGLKHLSDQDTYRKLDKDITKEVAENVVSTVRDMYCNEIIDKKVAEYLLPLTL